MVDRPSQDLKIKAAEAQQLRDNPAFQRSVLNARQRLLASLAVIDPLETQSIIQIQAQIRAIDLLAEMLADEIIRGTELRQVAVA
jgi:hypothetical protein